MKDIVKRMNAIEGAEFTLPPEYADKAKYGYCRSEEITGYVRQIIARYISYKSDIERLAQSEE